MSNNKKYIIIGIVSTLILMLGFTLAYFTPKIIGEGKKVAITAKDLSVVFTDNDSELTDETIMPGWSKIKTFSVENKSGEDFKYNLVIKELINTFVVEGGLVYKVTSRAGYNMEDYKDMPRSEEAKTEVLGYNIEIKNGEKQEYTFEIKYNNLETNQNEDIGKIFEGKLGIEDGTEDPYNKKIEVIVQNGSVEPSSKTIPTNTSTTFNITANEGYTLEDVTIDCTHAKGNISGNILTVSEVTKDTVCTVTIGEIKTLYAQLLKDNPTIKTRTSFTNAFTTTNTGTLYKASGNETEDGSDVYYFAGNAQNNWIKFGQDQEDNDLYWRIIRTNEDGSVRLLYIGPDPATESAFIKIDGVLMSGGSNITGIYNETYKNTMYVGYMYGTIGTLASNRTNTTSSPIKIQTDLWYSKTLNVKKDVSRNTYDKYVSKTAIYCNDRSGDEYTNSGTMYYSTKKRLEDAKSPSYKCGNNASKSLFSDNNVADKFSASTKSGGNGQLQYPIAQMTADEIAYIGGIYGYNALTWYYYNSANGSVVGDDYWWTMSPYYYFYGSNANVFFVYGSSSSGRLNFINVNRSFPGIRPVLSLKSCVKYVSGNGSSDIPYEVTIDSTCATAEN